MDIDNPEVNDGTATTQSPGDNSTKIATTAYADAAASGGVDSITGTANQVIASASTGDITLSTPQDIGTSSTPTFGQVTATTFVSNGQITLNSGNVLFQSSDLTFRGLSFRDTDTMDTGFLGIDLTDDSIWYFKTPTSGIIRMEATSMSDAKFNIEGTFTTTGTASIDQNVTTTGTPTFGNTTVNGTITVTGTVDGRDIATDGTKLDTIETNADVTDEANVVNALNGATLTAVTVATDDKVIIQDTSDSDNIKTVTTQAIADLANGGVSSITGTANQIIADMSTGDITLSAPQDIATTSNVTFNSMNIATGNDYDINNVSVLNATTLGSSVVNSSLTNVGTLTELDVDNLNLNGNAITSTSGSIDITPLAGQGLNIDLSTTGDLAINTNDFFIDTSTGASMMGTTTQGTNCKLTVRGGNIGTDRLSFRRPVDGNYTTVAMAVDSNSYLDIINSSGNRGIYLQTYRGSGVGDVLFVGSNGTGASDEGKVELLDGAELIVNTGNVTIDTDTLIVDSVNDRVAINKASATVPFDLVGASNLNGDVTIDDASLTISSDDATPLTIEETGGDNIFNVGVSGSGITTTLGVSTTFTNEIDFIGATNSTQGLVFSDGTEQGKIQYFHFDDRLSFTAGGSERMTVTSTAVTMENLAVTDNTISSFQLGGIELEPDAGEDLEITLSTTGDLLVNTNHFVVDTSLGTSAFGTTSTSGAQVTVDQSSSSGAIPVLALDQGDIDDTFIDFIGTEASDGSRSISTNTGETAAVTRKVAVEVNGTTIGWIRIYASFN